MRLLSRSPILWLALLLAMLGMFRGCDSGPTGVKAPNDPPQIRITSGPVLDSLHSYRATFQWTAFDADGGIGGYEYALDDTTAADSLRSTEETSVSIRFRVGEGRRSVPLGAPGLAALDTLSAHHTFHVRARDREDLASAFASAAFYAYTVAPATTIEIPDPRFLPAVGPTFEVAWSGEDLDGLGPPTRFTTRLVSVPPESVDVLDVGRLDRPGGGDPWTPFLERTVVRYDAVPPGAYLFGVRALDEAGAIEPELVVGRNVARLRVVTAPGQPILILSAGDHSVSLPTDTLAQKTFPMISGQTTTFAWNASAQAYGARIAEFAYGVDLESVDPEGPGWQITTAPTFGIRIDHPAGVEDSLHFLYLRVTDSIGQTVVADALLPVGPADFSRDILYVDDIGNDEQGSTASPTDADHDQRMLEVLLAEGRRRGLRIDQYEVQRFNGGIIPGGPDLGILRRYKLLVWSVRESGAAIRSTMLAPAQGEEPSFAVGRYVELGGDIWLLGNSALTNLTVLPPTALFGFSPGEIGYDTFHIQTERDGNQIIAGGFERARNNLIDRRRDGLMAAEPSPLGTPEGWPRLLAVREPYNSNVSGIGLCEGMFVGYEQGGRVGVFDTLYTYVANGRRVVPPISSRFDGAPCAFRFQGPDQGRTMVMSFPIDWWSDGAVDSLGRSALHWFLDEGARRRR